jgi:hypothetical protein
MLCAENSKTEKQGIEIKDTLYTVTAVNCFLLLFQSCQVHLPGACVGSDSTRSLSLPSKKNCNALV